MKYIYLITTFLLLTITQINAQKEFHLSQYMLHQPFVNPAAMSSYNNINGALLYKKQWVGLQGSPEIQAFNVNSPLKRNSNSHLGLTVIHDKIGVNDNFYVAASYAYALKVSRKTRFSFGLSAHLNDGNDVIFSQNSPKHIAPNFQYGMYYYSSKFYVGLVIPKLLINTIETTEQNTSVASGFDIKEWHYYLSGGYKFDLSNRTTLTTSTQLKQVTGAPLQIDINAIAVYQKKIGLGVSYRTSNEVVGLLTYQLTNFFKLTYSYDYSFSQLADYQSGTHEISLIFNLVNDKKSLFIAAPRF